MYPHRIRLRGPWQCTRAGEKPQRAAVPYQRADGDAGPILLMRKFGYPGRIDEHERVWITLDLVVGTAAITLNGHLLGQAQDGPFEADVTSLLAPHNQLEIGLQGSQLGNVAMEIRATAFLQDVCVRRVEGKLEVRGLVA